MKYTKDYGYTVVDGITQDYNAHVEAGGMRAKYAGADFRTPLNTPILADIDGIGRAYTDHDNKDEKGFILQSGGMKFEYVHFNKHQFPTQKEVLIKKGDIIGYAGASGHASGVHTHVALILNGVRVDPYPYMATINNLDITESEMEEIVKKLTEITTLLTEIKTNQNRYASLENNIIANNGKIYEAKIIGDNVVAYRMTDENGKWGKWFYNGRLVACNLFVDNTATEYRVFCEGVASDGTTWRKRIDEGASNTAEWKQIKVK